MWPSNMTLVKVASIGGIATVSMGLIFRNNIDYKIKQTEYYKEAIKTLRLHKAAVHLLGEPIKEKTIDVSNHEKNFTKADTAQYEVPIKGPKQNGTLYFWATKGPQQWFVNRIELGLESEPDRRLLIKSSNSAG